MMIHPTMASPPIHAAAAAWWATSVMTPISGQRIERECPAKAQVPSSTIAGSDAAVQYTSVWSMRYWNSTNHMAMATTMRMAYAIPASVLVAASIEPSDPQGAEPLTSDATTINCRRPSTAVATSDRSRMRRSSGLVPGTRPDVRAGQQNADDGHDGQVRAVPQDPAHR